jgi:hypothetical protein
MPLETYFPQPAPQGGNQYVIETGYETLHFTARLKSSEISLQLLGQPKDYLFLTDIENLVDIVFKKQTWVAKFTKGSPDFCIVNGYFSRPNYCSGELVFLDEDALVTGPKTPIAAAVYRIKGAAFLEANYLLNKLQSSFPAECHKLVTVTDPYS